MTRRSVPERRAVYTPHERGRGEMPAGRLEARAVDWKRESIGYGFGRGEDL